MACLCVNKNGIKYLLNRQFGYYTAYMSTHIVIQALSATTFNCCRDSYGIENKTDKNWREAHVK